MKDIVLFGAGGLAKEAVNMIRDGINYAKPNTYRILGFVVEEKYYKSGVKIYGFPVLGTEEWLFDHKDGVCCSIAIGDYTHERERIFRKLEEASVEIETLICPDAYIPSDCKIGKGCYFSTKVTLSADNVIGEGTFINSDVMVGHDVTIGNFCNLYPRVSISGNCKIGNHVNIGGASYILPKKRIGDEAIIAAGSIVFSNVKAGSRVMGNPAKKIDLGE